MMLSLSKGHFIRLMALLFCILFPCLSIYGLPVVSSVSPNNGPATGGTNVTIQGSGFTGTTAVHFGSIPAATFHVVSDTEITAITGNETGTLIAAYVDVAVTALSGTSLPNPPDDYFVFTAGGWFAFPTNINFSSPYSVSAVTINLLTNSLGVPITVPQPTLNGTWTNSVVTNDGKTLYLGSYDAEIAAINLMTNQTIATIPLPFEPQDELSLALTSDGKTLLAVSSGSGGRNPNFFTIDIATNAITHTVLLPTGSAASAVISNSNSTAAYVSLFGTGQIAIVDLTTFAISYVSDPNSIILTPTGMCLSPDGSTIYLATAQQHIVVVIDTTTNTVVNSFDIMLPPCDLLEIQITPDGNKLFVGDVLSPNFAVVDLTMHPPTVTELAMPGQRGIAVAPDGKFVYTCAGGEFVEVVDVATDTVSDQINVTTQIFPPLTTELNVSGISITPDQSPFASFAISSPTSVAGGIQYTFDASSSFSPVGTIVNYSWDFGDASGIINTSSPTIDHVYTSTGVFPVTLTVTNSAGTSTEILFTGRWLLRNGSQLATTSQNLDVGCNTEVTGVSPSSGPAAGGNTVIITGEGFDTATTVLFGAVPTTNFVINYDGQITVVAPAGTGTVDVQVVAPPCTSPTGPLDQYTYVPPPLAPIKAKGKQKKCDCEIFNILKWKAPCSGTSPVAYNIYSNQALTVLLATIPAGRELEFIDEDCLCEYFIVSVDILGQFSSPTEVTITCEK